MPTITKPIILNETGVNIATANARTAAALEAIAQLMAQDGGGGEGSGKDGFSPIVTITDITGGHRISIRDAVGTKTFDVLDGATGPQGPKGDTGATGSTGATGPAGADGFSPTLTVTTITGGHRVTITDANGSRYFDVMDGSGSGGGSGHDGFSPIVTVTDITGGHRVSIQDATSTKTFDVMDGAAGAKGDTGATGPAGANGVSPTVTVTNITGGHRVAITDATGTKTFDVMDGSGSGSATSNNPTLETEWKDVYSDWAAGYYYDPDNDYAYTQIPSSERTWGETQTYIATSCTPYSNMIAVSMGEEYRYRNMPVHFDSKNAEIPSIIIFDANKSEIEAYTRTFQDEWTEFTIPSGGAWMAVIYANSQTYSLQKKVAKSLDKKAAWDNVMADYRAYSQTVPPTPKALTKALICLGTDDIRPWETKNLHDLYTRNNIPYYMAAIPQSVKACVTDDPYKTNLDYMRLCVAAGGEIICHSDAVITEQNKTDFDAMDQYFRKGKEELESYGFTVRGIFKAGGEGSIYNPSDPLIDAWAAHYFEFGDYFRAAFPYNLPRTILEQWESYANLPTAISNIVQNHGYYIGTFHTYDQSAETAISQILAGLQGYTRGVDYDFVTPSQLFDALMPTTIPSGGGGTGATYGISMSNNVITLTGSDGQTSSVTLPVYNGGVS